MVWYLWKEWGLHVHRSTVSRILKRRRWSEKTGHRVGERQNEELRMRWIAELLDVVAEQLVYIDESIFNETTGWRHQCEGKCGQMRMRWMDEFGVWNFGASDFYPATPHGVEKINDFRAKNSDAFCTR